MNLKTKEYSYQPMNATEYFLHEIARNTETIVELLKQTHDKDILEGVEKELIMVTEAKAETKAEAKPEAKPEAKTETKAEAKTEAKPEAKAEAKTETKAKRTTRKRTPVKE